MTELHPVWQLGIVGLMIVFLIKFLDFIKMWWMVRNGKGDIGSAHCNQMEWVYNYSRKNEPALEKVRDGIATGAFGCTWKDRDEVIEHLHAIKENTKAMVEMTREYKKQNGR